MEFVSVTATLPTADASESRVKGCVYRNVVPYVSDVDDPYQVPNGDVRSTVRSVVFRDCPAAGVKWKCA